MRVEAEEQNSVQGVIVKPKLFSKSQKVSHSLKRRQDWERQGKKSRNNDWERLVSLKLVFMRVDLGHGRLSLLWWLRIRGCPHRPPRFPWLSGVQTKREQSSRQTEVPISCFIKTLWVPFLSQNLSHILGSGCAQGPAPGPRPTCKIPFQSGVWNLSCADVFGQTA